MPGKFRSLRDEVVYRVTLNGFHDDECGDVEGPGWHALVRDFYGVDYIVHVDNYGFVEVETFPEHILIDQDGYYDPAGREWEYLRITCDNFYQDED